MIAEVLGLDVSSVNKIPNQTPGPVFNPKTIKKVFATARRMGFRFKTDSKLALNKRVKLLEATLKELIPSVLSVEEIASRWKVTPTRAEEIRTVIYGKKSASA